MTLQIKNGEKPTDMKDNTIMSIDLNKLFEEYKRRNNIYDTDDKKVLIKYWYSFVSWMKGEIQLKDMI